MTRFPEDIPTGCLNGLVSHLYAAIRGREYAAIMRMELAMDELARRGVCSLVGDRVRAMRVLP